MGLLRKLHSIEVGPQGKGAGSPMIRPAALAELMRLLLMLLENGLSLPRALASLAADQSVKKHADVLPRLRLAIEAGGSLSGAMERFPRTFTTMQVQQIRMGERSGTLEKWLRDAAVLQFAEAISSMIECGYKPVEAVQVATECVRNREVRAAVNEVRRSMQRGERLSDQLCKHPRFFSSTLCQLVGVGEQSGEFAQAMRGTCNHLRERLETRIDVTVGLLEPTLTIALATAIGGIVLSIYTPMFHMFEVLE